MMLWEMLFIESNLSLVRLVQVKVVAVGRPVSRQGQETCLD